MLRKVDPGETLEDHCADDVRSACTECLIHAYALASTSLYTINEQFHVHLYNCYPKLPHLTSVITQTKFKWLMSVYLHISLLQLRSQTLDIIY